MYAKTKTWKVEKLTYPRNQMIQKYKIRIYEMLERVDPNDKLGGYVNFFIVTLILFNVVAVILESENTIFIRYELFFKLLESASIRIFTVEYALRLWTANVAEGYSDPIRGRLRYALKPLLVVDLMVLVPYYLPIIIPDLRFLRGVRVFWMFRFFKLGRYSESVVIVENVIKAKKKELVVTFLAIVFFLIVSSSAIYFLEHDAQPDCFPSIPVTMWWGVLTLTTIGYEDIYPITLLGKFVGSLVIILGVGMFALPTGILASGFVEEVQIKREHREKFICPHCGKSIEISDEMGKNESQQDVLD